MKFANSQSEILGALGPKPILLCTLNSAYIHSSFGLRYLYANMGELKSQTRILEFTIDSDPRAVVEALLEALPRTENKKLIVGFGVYIWNTNETEIVISMLKKIRPDICVVLGGPEVSHETEKQSLIKWADAVICGEADFAFREFCSDYFSSSEQAPFASTKIISAQLPEISAIQLPYDCFTEEDIANRIIYVEASRGCPYKCEYCLSSLDKSVRNFELLNFLNELEKLIQKGVRQFKFIDRTFNLSPKICTTILQFFLQRIELGLFLHFEMVPDRLPEEIKNLIAQFPAGSLQFEIGIQTLNPTVAALVSRKNDLQKVAQNFKFLREETKVHTHADLIAGLPGEDLNSFAAGFDHLLQMGPDEIQVGILKRLKGTPIVRHDQQWEMRYSEFSPFEILSTKTLSFQELQKIQQFSKHWDWIANSGRFKKFIHHWHVSCQQSGKSFFWQFMQLSDFIFQRHQSLYGLSSHKLRSYVREYLLTNAQIHLMDLSLLQLDQLVPEHEPQKPKAQSAADAATSHQALTPKRQQQHLHH